MKLHIAASPWLLLLTGLLLGACAQQPVTDGERVERQLLSHSLLIDAGDQPVLALPQRTLRITEQRLYQVSRLDARDQLIDQTQEYQTLPWGNRAVAVHAGELDTELHTDQDGILRLNLLHDDFINLDYDNLRALQLSVTAEDGTRAEHTLLVGRELRGKLHEAVSLIYHSLEQDEVDEWARRVHRLAELGLQEESEQLENMLILLTSGDPQLQADFIQALEERE
ncbi:MAG: hypothetical protein WAV92_05415 [Halopseudomonas yangmingensis]